MLTSSLHSGEEPDWRSLVLVIGELATYLCRSGEIRPFLVEAALSTETVLAVHAASPGVPSRRDAQLLAKLRYHLTNRNTVVVFPMQTSAQYRECLLLLLVQQLEVRTIIALSDVVADAFASGQRDCLVLHASASALSVGRVESGVTLAAKAPVDVCAEPYRAALVALVGDEVYECVVERRGGRAGGKGAREDAGGEMPPRRDGTLGQLIQKIIKGASSLPVVIAGEALRIAPALRDFLEETVRRCMEKEPLTKKSSSISSPGGDGTNSESGDNDDEDNDNNDDDDDEDDDDDDDGSNDDDDDEDDDDDGDDDDDDEEEASDHSSVPSSLLILSLSAGESWLLPVLGGSLVAQLSLSELSKLRITREDTLSSKGAIIHWRSIV